MLCPSTHPYPCEKGAMCAKAPFKPLTGNATDCDGKRLTEESICCPADNVIPCSADGPLFRCRANPPGKSKISEWPAYIYGPWLLFVQMTFDHKHSFFATTGCPKVRVIFDTPLFSGLGGPITKSFDVVIAECGWFFLKYNTHW